MSAPGISAEQVRVFLAYASAFQRLDKDAVADRAMGVRGAAIRELRVSEVSPQIALARVRWALQGSGDQPLYEFDASRNSWE